VVDDDPADHDARPSTPRCSAARKLACKVSDATGPWVARGANG
jgi:hypothetical protein